MISIKYFLFVNVDLRALSYRRCPIPCHPWPRLRPACPRHIPWIEYFNINIFFVLHHIIVSWYHAHYTAFYFMTFITDVSNQVLLPHHVAESPVPAVQMWQYGQRPPFHGPRRRSRRSAKQSILASHPLSPQAPLLLLVCVSVCVCLCVCLCVCARVRACVLKRRSYLTLKTRAYLSLKTKTRTCWL